MRKIDERMRWWQVVGWSMVLLAWLWACVIGNGFELQRQAILMPCLLAGTLLCCMGRSRSSFAGWPLGIMLAMAGYFFLRAIGSPIWDLARLDLILVAVAVLSMVAGSVALPTSLGRNMFLGFLIAVLAGHGFLGWYQLVGDPEFAFLRAPRKDQLGASGLYYHRNYLAGFLEICLPILGGGILTCRRSGLKWLGGSLLAGGLALAWATSSRAGFAACGVGILSVVIAWGVGSWSVLRYRQRVLAVVSTVGFMMLAVVVGVVGFKSIQLGRTGRELGLSDFVLRLKLSGLGFDVWRQSPPFGCGSRAYSYEVVGFFAEGQALSREGNPVMAHNDYIQVLSDYGFVGLLLSMAGVVVLFCAGLRTLCDPERRSGQWMGLALVGALLAAAAHALVDFNLHVLPNMMLLALLGGGCLGMGANRPGKLARVGMGIAVCLGAAVAFFTMPEARTTLAWLRMERLRGDEQVEKMRELARRAPEFHLMREIARDSKRRFLGASDPTQSEALAIRCVEDWRAVYSRHPRDHETIANVAGSLDWAGRFEEAETMHRKVLGSADGRENKYRLKSLYAEHLGRWGDHLWQSREPERARYYFEQSRAWWEESWEVSHHRIRKSERRKILRWLDARIRFLEEAGISSEPDSRILRPSQKKGPG